MAWWDDKLQDAVAAVTRGVAFAKLGPGVLGTIVPINTVGLVALAILGYALSGHPLYALIGVALGLAFLVYANERAFRYAKEFPIPSLLSGSEIFQLLKDQRGASDHSIVVEADPVMGASASAIVRKDDGNV